MSANPTDSLEQQQAALAQSVSQGGRAKISALLQQSSEAPDVAAAKSYLQNASERSGLNLYDHLSNILAKLLETRPANAVDYLEQVSADIKRLAFRAEQVDSAANLRRDKPASNALAAAKSNIRLFQSITRENPAEAVLRAENGEPPHGGELPDMMELANIWEWAGVSLGREETFALFISLRKLAEQKSLKSLRFWGRISAVQGAYFIAEGELAEGAADEDYTAGEALGSIEQQQAIEELNATNQAAAADSAAAAKTPAAAAGKADDAAAESTVAAAGEAPAADAGQAPAAGATEVLSADFFGKDPDTVKSKFVKTPPLTKEERAGANKYVYYVCTQIGGAWQRLPDVQPEQLQAARHVRKYFRGQLSRKVQSYPPFHGTEAAYLRCQIARISAATVISPAGYYAFDREEDDMNEEDDFEQSANVVINADYKGGANAALLDLNNWVHHVPYILPQGRTTWENPWARKQENQGDEDAEEEDADNADADSADGANGSDRVQQESGPPLLSPIAADAAHDGLLAWSVRVGSRLSPLNYSPVYLRSNRWPGAYAVAYGDKFCNLYLGDGLKDLGASPAFGNTAYHYPPALPAVQDEYPEPITEESDPTVEQEKAYEDELRAQREAEEANEEEEEDAEDA